ncbi:hypothetical protein CCE12_09935 [Escherichia coli]|nr:hypothetical protein CCE12_09935 [Escherichia coli]OWH15435.1 hypothetical protein CCE10_10755 [Escherichia coli]
MMNPVPWLQMTNMISYQGLVRTFLSCIGFIPECQCQRLTITKAAIVRCSPPGVEVVNRTNTVTNFQRVGLG